MYQVFKQVWDKNTSQHILQYVTEYPDPNLARTLAARFKGVVKINGTICIDLR